MPLPFHPTPIKPRRPRLRPPQSPRPPLLPHPRRRHPTHLAAPPIPLHLPLRPRRPHASQTHRRRRLVRPLRHRLHRPTKDPLAHKTSATTRSNLMQRPRPSKKIHNRRKRQQHADTKQHKSHTTEAPHRHRPLPPPPLQNPPRQNPDKDRNRSHPGERPRRLIKNQAALHGAHLTPGAAHPRRGHRPNPRRKNSRRAGTVCPGRSVG